MFSNVHSKHSGSHMVKQCFEKVDRVSQIIVADIPARHVCLQLCAVRVFTFHKRQAEFFRIELAFQG
jgi:hypothetical protein